MPAQQIFHILQGGHTDRAIKLAPFSFSPKAVKQNSVSAEALAAACESEDWLLLLRRHQWGEKLHGQQLVVPILIGAQRPVIDVPV